MRKPSKTIAQVEAQIEEPTKVKKSEGPRTLEVIRKPSGLYAIIFSAGGEVPDSLKTDFTSKNVAEAHIAKHLAEKALELKKQPSMFGMEDIRGQDCSE